MHWNFKFVELDLQDIIKASWNTSLPGDIVINERGFASDNNQVGFLMSKDTELTSAGYNQSFAMIDFGAVCITKLYQGSTMSIFIVFIFSTSFFSTG